MSSNHNKIGAGGLGRMSEERPLDSMLPGLGESSRPRSEPIDASAVHPRVLEVTLEDTWEWTVGVWFDPGAPALKARLRELIQVTVLSELSKSPDSKTPERNFSKMRLLAFCELSAPSREVIETMGFGATEFGADQYVERIAAWSDEAIAAGLEPPESPDAVYTMDISRVDPVISKTLLTIQDQMTKKLAGEFWGQTPGGPSRLMATYFRQYLNATVTPTRKGLHEFELFICQETQDCLRWIDPSIFQALCDFVGVILRSVYDLDVQWGICTPDSSGFAQPPVFRAKNASGYQIVPISLHLLNWCVMPRGDGARSLAESVDALVRDLE